MLLGKALMDAHGIDFESRKQRGASMECNKNNILHISAKLNMIRTTIKELASHINTVAQLMTRRVFKPKDLE